MKAQLRTLAANELNIGPYVSKHDASKQEAAWLFSLVDEDDSGLIDSDELKKMIEKTGQRVKEEELEHIMTVLDVDGSGEVDDTEFQEWYSDDSDLWLSRRRKHPKVRSRDIRVSLQSRPRFNINGGVGHGLICDHGSLANTPQPTPTLTLTHARPLLIKPSGPQQRRRPP